RGSEGRDYIFAGPVLALAAAHEDFVVFALSGMETGLLAAGLCWLILTGSKPRRECLRAVIGASLFLVHPEAVLVYPLALVFLNGGERAAWRAHLRPIAVFVGGLAVICAARWLYFGDLLPNTFYAKAVQPAEVVNRALRLLAGTNSNVSYPLLGLVSLLLMGAGVIALRRDSGRPAVAWLGAALVVGFAFAVYSNLDWTLTGRYFAPYAPLALLVFWKGVVEVGRGFAARLLEERTEGRRDEGTKGTPGSMPDPGCFGASVPRFRCQAVLGVVACLLVMIGMLRTLDAVSPERSSVYPGYVLAGAPLVEPSRWLAENLPPDAVIATRRIGAVGYYSGRRVFDYKFGLSDRAVARLIRQCGRQFDDPGDPALAELWRHVRPDYLIEDRPVLERIVAAAGGTLERFELHGIAYRARRSFRIGAETDWVLCERVELPSGPGAAVQ
ncbi:MAG: hypothetical protein AB1716_24365, partial [Planctomycetota bacterium]